MNRRSVCLFGGLCFSLICVIFILRVNLDNNDHSEIALDENTLTVKQALESFQRYLETSEKLAQQANSKAAIPKELEFFLANYPVILDGEILKPDPEHFKYLSAPYRHQRTEWYKSLGYFYNGELEAYAGYSIEILEALIEQGDFMAMHVLVEKYIHQRPVQSDSKDKLFDALETASIYGSTQALVRKGNLIKHDLYGYLAGHSDLDRDALIGWLAHNDVAVRRGDLNVQQSTEQGLEYFGLQLTESDWEDVQTASNALYENLEESRNNLGLGEFNNKIPDYVSGYSENLLDLQGIREYLEQHGEVKH